MEGQGNNRGPQVSVEAKKIEMMSAAATLLGERKLGEHVCKNADKCKKALEGNCPFDQSRKSD